MRVGGQTWFYWPVTVALSATLTALHLYFTALRNGRLGAPHALGGVFALALPVLPLAFATEARCHDAGAKTLFHPVWPLLLLSVPAWAFVLWALYRSAGETAAARPAIITLLATTTGFLVEYIVSNVLLLMRCNGTDPSPFVFQLAVAAVAAAITGPIVFFAMRSSVVPSR